MLEIYCLNQVRLQLLNFLNPTNMSNTKSAEQILEEKISELGETEFRANEDLPEPDFEDDDEPKEPAYWYCTSCGKTTKKIII